LEGLAALPIVITMNRDAIEWALTTPMRDESGKMRVMKDLPQEKGE